MHHHIMSKFWWVLVLRGLLGVFLGLAAIVWILALDQVFPEFLGSFLFSQASGHRRYPRFGFRSLCFLSTESFRCSLGRPGYGAGRRWWTLIVEGILSVSLGLLAWLWTEQAVLILL